MGEQVFTPIRNANYSVHSFENKNKTQKILFIEIWTNGSVTPKEALYEASRSLIDLFIPFLHLDKEEVMHGSMGGKKNLLKGGPRKEKCDSTSVPAPGLVIG